MKRENILLIIIIAALLIVAGFWFYDNKQNQQGLAGIILFYGDGCLHCKNVDDFISQNKIEEKVKFTRLEVFNDSGNAEILLNKAKICGMNTEEIGVPFLWDGNTCVSGDQDIIKFFQDATK